MDKRFAIRWPLANKRSVVLLALGVVLPLITLSFELLTRLSAEAYFDPVPTLWHVALVALVPLANGAVWFVVTREKAAWFRWAVLANGVTIGISAVYSLLFLPILPFAVMAIILYGLGLLVWAPLLSFIVALRLRAHLKSLAQAQKITVPSWRFRTWAGIALALMAFLAVDLRSTLTRLGATMALSESAGTRANGLRLIRTLGSEKTLLRMCYIRTEKATDFLGILITLNHPMSVVQSRELYYRMTGRAFNSVPAPVALHRGSLGDFWGSWDADQGSDQVGAQLSGLTLASSRLDGSVAADAALGYLEWTMVFRNESHVVREARAQIALPPGAVVSRTTLWINGEEREAAFAGRSEVRAAYQAVVSQRRDPVLVTTAGADRISVQLFPVPSFGEMKVRIGMTVPLQLSSMREGVMRLPYFNERNFSIGDGVRHAVWIESKAFDTGKVRRSIADEQLGSRESSIPVKRSDQNMMWAADPRVPLRVVRQLISVDPVSNVPRRLVLVVDGSASMEDFADSLAKSVAMIPANVEVRLVLARDGVDGSPDDRVLSPAKAAELIRGFDYIGGHDNTAALVRALDLASEQPGTALVWIHGPQPVLIDTEEALVQRLSRGGAVERWYELQIAPGRNLITEKLEGLAKIQTLRSEDFEQMAVRWRSGARSVLVTREYVQAEPSILPAAQRGSDHLVRLWANDEIARLIHGPTHRRAEAIELANRYQLVTPVSGAVVLETQQQYRSAGLEPVPEGTVPTIPEPEDWALLIVALVALGYAFHKHRTFKRARQF